MCQSHWPPEPGSRVTAEPPLSSVGVRVHAHGYQRRSIDRPCRYRQIHVSPAVHSRRLWWLPSLVRGGLTVNTTMRARGLSDNPRSSRLGFQASRMWLYVDRVYAGIVLSAISTSWVFRRLPGTCLYQEARWRCPSSSIRRDSPIPGINLRHRASKSVASTLSGAGPQHIIGYGVPWWAKRRKLMAVHAPSAVCSAALSLSAA